MKTLVLSSPTASAGRLRRRSTLVHLLLTALVAAAAALPGADAAHANTAIPTDIAAPAGNKLFLTGHAVGVQIYTCNPNAGGYAWSTNSTPRADLLDDNGKLLATHYGGPTWQARDGSTVVGKREAGVTVDSDAIPWLRLSASSTAAGIDGSRLVPTTYILRINTSGGLVPPASECNALTAGTSGEVPYTADYLFYKAQGA
jgi:hypothetical protein